MKFGAPFVVAALIALAGGEAQACLDEAKAPSTRWSIAKDHGIAWLMTPCGGRFFSLGVDVVDAGASGANLNRPHYDWSEHATTFSDWARQARDRLIGWGFNTAGAWSLPPQLLKLPSMINLELGRQARFHWFDPFDPAAKSRLDEMARRLTAPYRDTPYRVGYFSDNEVGWWSGALFVFYSKKPAANFTKQRWVAELKRRYHRDWGHFVRDFVPPKSVGSWRALLHAEAITQLRPGGHGAAAVRHWTSVVAERYYALTAAALRHADPNALFLGDRLPIYYDPAALRVESRHVDAISTNYNVDSPEGWIAPYYFDGIRALSQAKPVIVSEWFYAARDNRTGNLNNGHLMTVATQAERARGAGAAAAQFAEIPELVGLDWFQLYDYPEGGRADSEDYNFGLVDIHDRPYQLLAAALTAVNKEAPGIHAHAQPAARPSRTDSFAVPKVEIDFSHPSFIDWPKASAALPPLRPGPGDIAFGQMLLSWSDKGLALATVGQDYYDLDLLAYRGAFPLGEAYRVELDVDAGAGPKRFTLYFIPPRTKAKDHPPMAPKLCAGAPSEHHGGACPQVPGGDALYFGADQPRIAAEMRVPWSAIGLDGPPADRKLRIEVSSTAWFRGRWMSLSGLPPARSSARPGTWRPMVLSDGARAG